MPAQLSGLESFGGFGQTGNPNITQSNAAPNTAFNFGVSNAGVGTGSLGEFGGYIPTPLPQFNNYADYMMGMPGAQIMDQFANIGLSGPGVGDVGWNANLTSNPNNNIGSDAPLGGPGGT